MWRRQFAVRIAASCRRVSGSYPSRRASPCRRVVGVGLGEQGPFVIGPIVAGQQVGPVHLTEVDYRKFMPGGGRLKYAWVWHRPSPCAKEGLLWVYTDEAANCDVVVEHTKLHLRFAAKLYFDVALRAVSASGEQIHAGVADFGEFHVGPFIHYVSTRTGENWSNTSS
jgi:hypothetical protein